MSGIILYRYNTRPYNSCNYRNIHQFHNITDEKPFKFSAMDHNSVATAGQHDTQHIFYYVQGGAKTVVSEMVFVLCSTTVARPFFLLFFF